MKFLSLNFVFFLAMASGYSQCDSFTFAEIGYDPAYCRTMPYQSGNGVVYAAATGGTEPYSYLWTNVQTGQTSQNTTWGGLNVGDYFVKVIDSVGCVLTETVKVDSLNPHADFVVKSVAVDNSFPGLTSAEVTLLNKSWGGPMAFPGFEEPHYFWNSGGDTTWHDLFYWQEFTTTFTNVGPYQICLVETNKNQCTDTLCVWVDVVPPVDSSSEVDFLYSSSTGEASVNLDLPYGAWFKLMTLDGTTVFEILLEPGLNMFSLPSGLFVYQVIDSVNGSLLANGTLIIN